MYGRKDPCVLSIGILLVDRDSGFRIQENKNFLTHPNRDETH